MIDIKTILLLFSLESKSVIKTHSHNKIKIKIIDKDVFTFLRLCSLGFGASSIQIED
jgi:hypothetical protein